MSDERDSAKLTPDCSAMTSDSRSLDRRCLQVDAVSSLGVDDPRSFVSDSRIDVKASSE